MAILLGGGGSPAALAELAVEIAAIVSLCGWAIVTIREPRSLTPDRMLWCGMLVLIAIPLAQLIPLPPALWHALPGREVEIASLTLIHQDATWQPLSLAPYRTFASLLSLLAPVAIVGFASQLDIADRTRLLMLATGLILAAAVVGVLQVAAGQSQWFRAYPGTDIAFETGFQANRNSAADVLLVGIVMTVALATLKLQHLSPWVRRSVLTVTTAFLALSVVLTGSRAGTALLPVCLVVAVALMRPRLRVSWTSVVGGVVALLLVAGLVLSVKDNPAIDRTWQRFAEHADARPDLWQDTRYAIGNYWPVGSGVGTFTTVFPAAERLEVVDTFSANRAHNDYLEFTLETGIFGPVAIVAAMLAMAWRLVAILRGGVRRTAATHAILGSGIGGILALHSVLDYPMRSMSLAVLAGLAVSLLARPPRPHDPFARSTG